ncbi:MAG: nitroreductase family protein [Clostridia bacterium]|nr:nitroreductase family protein [Clostridia bacterium]
MAETLTVLKTRRSIRAYKPDPVEQEKRNAIIEAGTYTAIGMGKQSPLLLVIKNQEIRDKLKKCNAAVMGVDMDLFYGESELLVVLANKDVPYLYDGSLVMGNRMNAAADLGVASCWIHRSKEEFESEEGRAVLSKLGIEGNYEGIGNLALGYAVALAGKALPRKDIYVYRV